MGNCCSSKTVIKKKEHITEKTEANETRTPNRPKLRLNLEVKENTRSKSEKVEEVLNKSAQLLALEHQLIYRNQKFTQTYTILEKKCLAIGTRGKVIVVQHNQTGLVRACRIIKNRKYMSCVEKAKTSQLVQEMRKLDHPSLLKIFDFFQDDQHQYLVVEHCEGGTFFDQLQIFDKDDDYKTPKTLPEDVINIPYIFRQILSALKYLHKNNIFHKNIQPNKILFSKFKGNLIKLTGYNYLDLNLFDDTDHHKDISYMPPEYFFKKQVYNNKSDVWQCGVMLAYILSGTHPFKDKRGQEATKNNILRGQFHYGFPWDKFPNSAKELLSLMLKPLVKDRISASQCLKMDFINKSQMNIAFNYFALRQLKLYQTNENKLRQILVTMMVDRLMTQNERELLTMEFQKIDTNNDGKVSRHELKQRLKETMSSEQADIEVNKIFKAIDCNNNEYLDFNEFLIAACDQRQLLCRKNVDEFFNLIDRDKSGQISAIELSHLFCNTDFTKQQWACLLSQADQDKNGHISKDEFYQLMSPLATLKKI